MIRFIVRADGTGKMKCPFCEEIMEFQKIKPSFENKQVFIDAPDSMVSIHSVELTDLHCKSCLTHIDTLKFTKQKYEVVGE
jgi:hypothetical protein